MWQYVAVNTLKFADKFVKFTKLCQMFGKHLTTLKLDFVTAFRFPTAGTVELPKHVVVALR